MTTERKHRCGGKLVERQVQIVLEESAGLSVAYRVDGLICNKCGEQLIDRETALKLQVEQTPTVVWRPERAGTTWLDAIKFEPNTAVLEAEAVA